MDKKSLSGKNALITGGNRGVGKELVKQFAQNGCNIIFNSSKKNEDAEKYAQQISAEYNIICIYTPCNIANPDEIEAMCNLAKEKFKRIDILINNAGRACFGAVENLKLADYEECMAINMTAPFLFCQKLITEMKANKWGRIINFSSGTTVATQPNLGAYIAAKNSVNSLTKVLAKEVGDFKITVNCLVPGCIDTDMLNDGVKGFAASVGYPEEAILAQTLGSQIIKEKIQPSTLAAFSLYLCSDMAAGLTGGLFPVDHGFTA